MARVGLAAVEPDARLALLRVGWKEDLDLSGVPLTDLVGAVLLGVAAEVPPPDLWLQGVLYGHDTPLQILYSLTE